MTRIGAETPWHARPEAGVGFGLWLVERVARVFGRRVAHAFVAPISAYFMLTRVAERRASQQFLSRALGRPAKLLDCFRHFYTFARVSVDRVFLLSPHGHRIRFLVSGKERMEHALHAGRGCILISAHLGSFEAARQAGLMNNPALRLRVLLDRAVNQRLIRALERIDVSFAAGIIDAAGDPRAVTLQIGECLRQGEWVGWLADRHRGGERTVPVEFLGQSARFPTSPFIIARLFRVPVFLVLAVYEAGAYRLSIDELLGDADLVSSDRAAAVQQDVVHFAARLEQHAQAAPFNWFNFYDFWAT